MTIPFRPLSIEDKTQIESYLHTNNYHMCEQSFVDLFIWKDHYQTMMAVEDDTLYLVQLGLRPGGQPTYFPPYGKHAGRIGIDRLQDDARARGKKLIVGAIPIEIKEAWEREMPGRFRMEERRDYADYLYDAERIIRLSGKKLHGKRNHINRFLAENDGRWRFDSLTKERSGDVLAFHQHWNEQKGMADDPGFLAETKAIQYGLEYFDELGLVGGILYLDERIIAFTFGAPLMGDTMVIQIEKADYDVHGAYAVINQQFAKHHCTTVQYINREDDLGIQGLRRSKLSYDPLFLTMKYCAEEAHD